MTAERRQRKQSRALMAALAGLVSALFAAAPAVRAIATERIVVDWHTGLAIGGYDPVAFFTDSKPIVGRPDFEFAYGGTVWRFANVGDRAAFAERPDVYMPQFGGYDPVGVASGVAVAGNPDLWLIAGGRLFLFYDRNRLAAFSTDSEHIIGTADRKWAHVMGTLSP
jgi:hypothetical protein